MKKIDWAEVREGYKYVFFIIFLLAGFIFTFNLLDAASQTGRQIIGGIILLLLINIPIIHGVYKKFW